jgi:hypothetical protein
MKSIENRLKTLEANAMPSDNFPRIVFVDVGETEAEALARSGHDPKEGRYLFVNWVSAVDANI